MLAAGITLTGAVIRLWGPMLVHVFGIYMTRHFICMSVRAQER